MPDQMLDRDAAAQALAYLSEMSPDMRGGAILDDGGKVLASSDGDGWGEATAALLEAADRDGRGTAEQIHVATEEGEVFALRHGDLTAVVVTDRLVLASLMAFDMRAALRDLTVNGTSASTD